MYIDASALVAILGDEDDAIALEQRLLDAGGQPLVSALVRFEAILALARVIIRNRPREIDKPTALAHAREVVDEYLDHLGAREVAVSTDEGDLAISAAMTYGRVVGHKAGLNFGDCFSYACAKANGVPLLYKGNDFSQTDLA